jgi:drug/metabolite transporter (DMT)-like permease
MSESRSNNTAMGVLFILIGSSSYGMLSTFVKLAYKENFTTAEVTVAQILWGAVILTIMDALFNKNGKKPSAADRKGLLIAGVPIALTSVLYYLTVIYIDASVAVVLLMQSVWMGVIVESFQEKKFPSLIKILAVALVLFGTLLATKLLGNSEVTLDIRGIVLGMLTAMSFSWTLYSTNAVANHLPAVTRSKIMLYGSCGIVLIFAFLTQLAPYYLDLNLVSEGFIRDQAFNPKIFLTYGLFLGIFGTVIPPIMLNKGFPIVGVGLGSILSSMELPVAVFVAFSLLGEVVNGKQWLGVLIILLAIVLLNYKFFTRGK